MKVYYAEFLYPGLVIADSSERRLDSEHAAVIIPERCFGYCKFWREERKVGDDTLIGPKHMLGGWTYIGTRQTLADIPDTQENHICRTNMRVNGYEAVVRTKWGQAFPLGKDDTVIQP